MTHDNLVRLWRQNGTDKNGHPAMQMVLAVPSVIKIAPQLRTWVSWLPVNSRFLCLDPTMTFQETATSPSAANNPPQTSGGGGGGGGGGKNGGGACGSTALSKGRQPGSDGGAGGGEGAADGSAAAGGGGDAAAAAGSGGKTTIGALAGAFSWGKKSLSSLMMSRRGSGSSGGAATAAAAGGGAPADDMAAASAAMAEGAKGNSSGHGRGAGLLPKPSVPESPTSRIIGRRPQPAGSTAHLKYLPMHAAQSSLEVLSLLYRDSCTA
jgi:hypothetical protein